MLSIHDSYLTLSMAATVEQIKKHQLSPNRFDRHIQTRVCITALFLRVAFIGSVEALCAIVKLPFAAIKLVCDTIHLESLPSSLSFEAVGDQLKRSKRCITAFAVDFPALVVDPGQAETRLTPVQSKPTFFEPLLKHTLVFEAITLMAVVTAAVVFHRLGLFVSSSKNNDKANPPSPSPEQNTLPLDPPLSSLTAPLVGLSFLYFHVFTPIYDILKLRHKMKDQVVNLRVNLLGQAVLSSSISLGVGLAMCERLAQLPSISLQEIHNLVWMKDKEMCRAPFDNSLLHKINMFKQWEIKHLAALTALIPLAISMICHIKTNYQSKTVKEKGLIQTFIEVSKEHLKELRSVTVSLMMAMATGYFGLGTYKTFDSSGHIMMKTVVNILLMRSIFIVQKLGNPRAQLATGAFSLIYGLTDSVLVYRTSRYCHSLPEVEAGAALGRLYLFIGSRF